jgi:hypothetical protein
VILAAVPITAPAIVVIVAAVEEEKSAPEVAVPAEIAISASEAREPVTAACGKVTAACREIATPHAPAAYTAWTATPMNAAGKHERSIAAASHCCDEWACRCG